MHTREFKSVEEYLDAIQSNIDTPTAALGHDPLLQWGVGYYHHWKAEFSHEKPLADAMRMIVEYKVQDAKRFGRRVHELDAVLFRIFEQEIPCKPA